MSITKGGSAVPFDQTHAGSAFEIIELRGLTPDDPALREARTWVEGMTPERDDEDGPDFWRWIERHRVEDAHNPLFGTRLLREAATGRIVATASLVSDDRDVGRRLHIEGIWLGGVNVCSEYRGQNIVNVILDALAADVQRAADMSGEEIAVNLVTAPHLVGLYARHGFEKVGPQKDSAGGETVWCRKIFRPVEGPGNSKEAAVR
jgi:predicted GNAT family N-acyltransferase